MLDNLDLTNRGDAAMLEQAVKRGYACGGADGNDRAKICAVLKAKIAEAAQSGKARTMATLIRTFAMLDRLDRESEGDFTAPTQGRTIIRLPPPDRVE